MKEILECNTISEILKTTDYLYRHASYKRASIEELLHIFDLCKAYWYHNGNPIKPHAELTSGFCSNGFFDCLRVLKYINISKYLAFQLACKISDVFDDNGFLNPVWVIGSPMAGITFAHDVAIELNAPINMCVEKDPKDSKKMLWNRMKISSNEPVFQIEELTTTAHTLNEVHRAIIDGNEEPVKFLPYIGILVHRPPKLVTHYGEREVISLIEKEIWAVPQKECPLCAQGSKRFRPKQNWAELTG